MPSFAIHLAISERYIEKHPGEIKNREEFLLGSVAPDLYPDFKKVLPTKVVTHYQNLGTYKINFNDFYLENKVDITTDFGKGYLLHLWTDDRFYNFDFKTEFETAVNNGENLHNDWSSLNKYIFEKYTITAPNDYISQFFVKDDTPPKYLSPTSMISYIEKMSDISINEIIEISKT